MNPKRVAGGGKGMGAFLISGKGLRWREVVGRGAPHVNNTYPKRWRVLDKGGISISTEVSGFSADTVYG